MSGRIGRLLNTNRHISARAATVRQSDSGKAACTRELIRRQIGLQSSLAVDGGTRIRVVEGGRRVEPAAQRAAEHD